MGERRKKSHDSTREKRQVSGEWRMTQSKFKRPANPAYNYTIPKEKDERFWTLHMKAIFLGGLWWLQRALFRRRVRPYRAHRGELLVEAARRIAKRKGWKGIYEWQWVSIFGVMHDVAATDNAYEKALYETIHEYAKLAKKDGVPEWRKWR